MASGSGTVGMFEVVRGEESEVEYIVPRDPGTLFWTVPLPVNKVFQAGSPSSRVEDGLYPMYGFFFDELGRRRHHFFTRVCEGR